MFLLFLSSFLFGLSNPVGALLVESEDALIFSFQFLAMLTVIQLPLIILKWREVIELTFKREFILLIISGFIGTFLYWCEFSSFQVGLPIAHVTFLSLTVPAWILIYEYARGRGKKWAINKWAIALIGSFFLIRPDMNGVFSPAYLLPIFTSILTAFWLIYSKKCQEAGVSPIVCSFFNDFFSLLGVLGFILFNGRHESLVIPSNLGNIFMYCALIGVLPNLFLFQGLKTAGIVAASTIIMLEPVISWALSLMINNDVLGVNFLIGALFVVASNLPNDFFLYVRRLRFQYMFSIFR